MLRPPPRSSLHVVLTVPASTPRVATHHTMRASCGALVQRLSPTSRWHALNHRVNSVFAAVWVHHTILPHDACFVWWPSKPRFLPKATAEETLLAFLESPFAEETVSRRRAQAPVGGVHPHSVACLRNPPLRAPSSCHKKKKQKPGSRQIKGRQSDCSTVQTSYRADLSQPSRPHIPARPLCVHSRRWPVGRQAVPVSGAL